ncbi:MAG: MFS transporter, partial [Actinomycetota bacterium]
MRATPAAGAPAVPTPAWLLLLIVCLGQFMVILDATIVNVALPTIQADLGFSATSLQWVVNSYTLMFGGFLLLGGRAADLFGRRNLFVAGVAVFTIASLLDGLAGSPGLLIAARALQGLGAALVSPAALSIVTSTFPDGRERTRALGIWAAIAVGGGAVGLLLGGILTEYLSWRWIFFVNLPVGILTVVLAARLLPESRLHGRRGFDLAGAATVTGGLMLLVYGIVKAQDFGWTSPRTLGLLGGAAALIALFVLVELRSRHPLVRLGILRVRSLTAANAAMLAVAGGMFAVFFLSSLYLQDILRLSPVETGLGFLPLTAGVVLASGLSQRLIPKLGVRSVTLAGTVIAAAGLILLSLAPADGAYLADVLPAIVVMGVGMGFVFVPLTLIGTTNVAAEDAGLASGLFNTSQQVGGALGVAILATVASSRTTDVLDGIGSAPTEAQRAAAVVDGFQVAFLTGAGLMILGAVLVALLVRRRDVAAIQEAEAS